MLNHSIFTNIDHGIAMSLRSAYFTMHRHNEACIIKHGITSNQFVVLSLLAQEDGITQQELCRRAYSDPNTIRAILILLEKRGLIERTQDENDGRKLQVTITKKGSRLFEKLWVETEPVRKRFLTLFDIKEIEKLTTRLKRISEGAKGI
jgi:DNA-binding MarR family transcriptional regulator